MRYLRPGFGGGSGGASGGGAGLSTIPLSKVDRTTPAFEVVNGRQEIRIKAGSQALLGGSVITFAEPTAVSTPTHSIGNYSIWLTSEGLIADSNFSSPPEVGAVQLGGYHWAGGGPAASFNTGGSGGPGIWPSSVWDRSYRPGCGDPRGMACVVGEVGQPLFWIDIYPLAQNHLNGTSIAGAAFANGTRPPRIPVAYGGNGSANYSNCSQDVVAEVLAAHGKGMLDFAEFSAAGFGVIEAESLGGSDPVTTQYRAARASKFAVDIAGVVYCWGRQQSGPFAGATWEANTGGRGSRFNQPNASLFGGPWPNGSVSGSRCVAWNFSPAASNAAFGGRGRAGHLSLV